jgi:hypothetical protein
VVAIDLPNDRDVHPVEASVPPFLVRYLSLRSGESRALGEVNQDALALRFADGRLTFALCDGVGQSFRGDLAAGMVSAAVADWLLETRELDPAGLIAEGERMLAPLAAAVQSAVDADVLPADLPELLREVLETKRRAGSETTIAAGLLDSGRRIFGLVWCGDSGYTLDLAGDDPLAGEPAAFGGDRWSSRRGLTGPLRARCGALPEGSQIAVWSDGFRDAPEPADWGAVRAWSETATPPDDSTILSIKIMKPLLP